MTEITIKKLEEAFAIGCSDVEACLMANISTVTLYAYQKNNPEFINRKETLKEKPFLKARKTIVDDLDDVNTAKWYAERKKKEEFSSRSELTGKDGTDLVKPILGGLTQPSHGVQEDNRVEQDTDTEKEA